MKIFPTQGQHSRDFVAFSLCSKHATFYPKMSLRIINKVKEKILMWVRENWFYIEFNKVFVWLFSSSLKMTFFFFLVISKMSVWPGYNECLYFLKAISSHNATSIVEQAFKVYKMCIHLWELTFLYYCVSNFWKHAIWR